MITRDPYGISGAVAPWRSLDAIEPIVERNITERDAEEAAICGQCPLPDCNPKRVGCLLHTRAKKPKPSRDLLERMALDGYGPETIAQATGYSISITMPTVSLSAQIEMKECRQTVAFLIKLA